MRGRLFAVTVGVASVTALAAGAIISACYSPPEPICGFVCGSGTGSCPDDYTCRSDNRCHLNGSPMMSCTNVDAGIDGPPDAVELFDVPPPPPDAAIDAQLIDAMTDAAPDAMPDAAVDAMTDAMVDAMDDAMVDAAPDAMTDALTDAQMIDALDAPPPVDSAPGLDAADPDAGVPADAASD